MRDSNERQLVATRHLLDPDNQDSPLFRLVTGVQAQIALVLDSVGRLAEQVAVNKAAVDATTAAMERSAIKGLAFEDTVVQAVTRLAATWGDVTDGVGRVGGATGGNVGDVVVELAANDTGGRSGRYVLECKDQRHTLGATLGELRRAAANREASAAIAVFAHADESPVPGPFAVFDDLAIIVYDKDDLDEAALHLACSWARWVVRRHRAGEDAALEAGLIHSLLADARRALDRVANIRRAHSAAARKIKEAAGQVDDLSSELSAALDKVDHAFRAPST